MKKILHNKIFLILVAIIIAGAFLRLFHFGDWMHYQLDQARDYRIVQAGMEYGPGELPLQGPRAAGSFLRLGPLFYYMQYGSALIFGDSPIGANMIVVLLNILAIPLFYVFLRRFFAVKLLLGLTALFASSLFLVSYSRFGWNPNTIVFFALAFAYCLLRIGDQENKNCKEGMFCMHFFKEKFLKVQKNDAKHAHKTLSSGEWLVLAAISLAFLTNMHFLALAAAPVIGLIYLGSTRPKIRLRYWMGAIVVFLFLNTPLIVNDVKTGGDNVEEFFAVVFERGNDEDGQRSMVDKLVKNIGLHAQYFWLINSGYQYAEFPELKGRDIQCDHVCRQNIGVSAIALLAGLAGMIAWIWFYRREKDCAKKNFLLLVCIWQLVVFVAYTPLAYDLAPRFFLLTAPLNFVLLGLIIHAGFVRGKKHDFILGWLIIGLLIVSNVVFVGRYFHELSRAATDPTLRISSDRILKEKTRVTLGQIDTIVDVMEIEHKKNGDPIFMHAQAEYKRAFWERIDTRGIDRDHIPGDLTPIYANGNYFVVVRTQSDQEAYLSKYHGGFDIESTVQFGTLTLYHLKQKENAITGHVKEFAPKQRDPRFSRGVQIRYLWRQVFSDEKL